MMFKTPDGEFVEDVESTTERGREREGAYRSSRSTTKRPLSTSSVESTTSTILEKVQETLSRYLVTEPECLTAEALYCLHTYVHDAAEASPLLGITAAEPGSGKTTTLTLLRSLVREPFETGLTTEAALFRSVQKFNPTLLMDEADRLSGRYGQALAAVLRAGFTKSMAYVTRCVGDRHEPKRFFVWCPKIFAMNGVLSDNALQSRTIEIRMKKALPSEHHERLRAGKIHDELEPLREELSAWGEAAIELLRDSDPVVPAELNDRAADKWRPLLAIAELAGEQWAEKARHTAVFLTPNNTIETGSLLYDIRELMKGQDRIWTQELIKGLIEMDDRRPWAEWNDGEPIRSRQLADMLRPYGINPFQIRKGEVNRNGYAREQFQEAWQRHLDTERN